MALMVMTQATEAPTSRQRQLRLPHRGGSAFGRLRFGPQTLLQVLGGP